MTQRALIFVVLALALGAAGALWFLMRGEDDLGLGGGEVGAVGEADAIRRKAKGAAASRPAAEAESQPTSEPAASMPASAPADPGPLRVFEESFGSLVVHVVWAEDKAPAPFVKVEVYEFGAPDPYSLRRWEETNESGDLIFENFHAGGASISTIFGGDLRPKIAAGEKTEATLEIPAGDRLAGVVVDAAGRAVSTAEIWLSPPHSMTTAQMVATTGADGRFILRAVSTDGLPFIGARKKGYGPSMFVSLLGATDRVKSDLRLVLGSAGGALDGRVVDPDGAPVPFARVTVGSDDSRQTKLADGTQGAAPLSMQMRTDAAGRFHAEGLDLGECPIWVRTPKLAPWTGKVTITADPTAVIEVRLLPGAVVYGRVFDAEHRPVAKASVETKPEEWRNGGEYRTKADGRYRIEGAPAGKMKIVAEAPGGEKAMVEAVLVAGTETEVDLVVGKGKAIRGRIVDEAEKPVPNLYVEVMTIKGGADFDSRFIRADKEGRFEALSCRDKDYRLEVRHPTAGSDVVAKLDRVQPGGDDLVIRVSSEALGEATIRAAFTAPDGEPLGGLEVLCHREGNNGTIIRTSESKTGRFEAKPVSPGVYTVDIPGGLYPPYRSEKRTLKSGDVWDLGVVRLSEGGSVTLVPRRPAGFAGRATIHANFLGGADHRTATLESESVTLSGLSLGEWGVGVTGDGIFGRQFKFTVLAGPVTAVDVPIDLGTTIVVTIDDGSTTSGGWADVSLTSSTGGEPNQSRCYRWLGHPFEARFGVAAGEYAISVVTEDKKRGTARVTVDGAGDVRTLNVPVE